MTNKHDKNAQQNGCFCRTLKVKTEKRKIKSHSNCYQNLVGKCANTTFSDMIKVFYFNIFFFLTKQQE